MGGRVGPLLFGAALVVALALTFRTAVEGDGVGYVAYLHSAWVDHDLDFANEYAAALAGQVPVDHRLLGVRTSTGHIANYFPVGAAVLASPAYLVALLIDHAGEPQYGMPFAAAFTLTSLLAGLVALSISWRLTSSAIAVAAVAVATPYTFYLLYAAGYSHMFSALAVSLFVLLWWRTRERRTAAAWVGLGLLGGLMALIRFQDGLLLLLVLLDVRRARWRVLTVVPVAALVFVPQLVVDQILFGTLLPQRPLGQGLGLVPAHALDVLLASWNGLFIWHPLTLLAVVGMALVRDRALRAACLLAFVLEVVIDGAAPDWWGGLAFGGRRFIDLTPFFAVGFASLAARVDRRVAWGVVAAGAVWNLLLMANLIYVIRYEHDPGYGGLLLGQLEAVRWLPHLLVKGEALRDVALGLIGRQSSPGTGVALMAALAAAVALAIAVARWRRGVDAGGGISSRP
jgi:hypothetical protein